MICHCDSRHPPDYSTPHQQAQREARELNRRIDRGNALWARDPEMRAAVLAENVRQHEVIRKAAMKRRRKTR